MQISQNLKLKQSQSLVMTPQLQQAIKLLQLNNVELCELVEKELEENPFLEKDNESDLLEQRNNEYTENVDEAFQNGESQYEDPSKGDYENRWDQDNNLSSKSNNLDTIDPGSIAEQTISEKVTLKSVLMEQANIAFKTSKEKIVSEILIDYIQPSGWLTTDLVELQNTIGCDEQTLNNVLIKMQGFEPAGVFARNLTECLRIQLKNQDLLTDGVSLLIENFDLLTKGEIKNLCKICGMSENELTDSIKIIKTLNPKPGSLYSDDNEQIFHPDVIVTQKDNQWEVELNNGTLPKIIVNENYIKELEKLGGNENDK